MVEGPPTAAPWPLRQRCALPPPHLQAGRIGLRFADESHRSGDAKLAPFASRAFAARSLAVASPARLTCGCPVRHQHAIGPYVADFYCPAAKLVIEIDGMAHDMGDRPERDDARDAYIQSLGLGVLRISARDVLRDVVAVADGLVQLCAKH